MKKEKLNISYQVYNNAEELNTEDQALLKEARKITKNAWAPYSKYRVGAALRISDGSIVCGSNQENIAFPSGLCAERVALNYAMSEFPGKNVESIAITAFSEEFVIDQAVTPCGSCRQVISEVENRQDKPIRILCMGMKGDIYVFEGINSLLPFSFKADQLKK